MDRLTATVLLLAATFQVLILNASAWDLADSCPRQYELNCFVCDTSYDRFCGDPFDAQRPQSRYLAKCNGGCCMKVSITDRDGQTSVQRKCTSGMSEHQIRNSINEPYWSNNRETGTISICDTNLCNTSPKQLNLSLGGFTFTTLLSFTFAFYAYS